MWALLVMTLLLPQPGLQIREHKKFEVEVTVTINQAATYFEVIIVNEDVEARSMRSVRSDLTQQPPFVMRGVPPGEYLAIVDVYQQQQLVGHLERPFFKR